MINGAGYLRALLELHEGASTGLRRDPDDPYDPADDPPFTVLEVISALSPGSVPAEAWAITGMDANGPVCRRGACCCHGGISGRHACCVHPRGPR